MRSPGYRASFHALLWIAAITLIFSISTMTLAALAQNTSYGYPRTVTGILQSLTELRREIREVGSRIVQVESTAQERELISTTPATTPTETAPAPKSIINNISRTEETVAVEPPATSPPPVKENVPEPSPAPSPAPEPKESAPQPNPEKEKNLQTCLQQCEGAFNKCIAATNETPLVPYPGNDWLCVENNEKECKGLCSDWFFFPTPTKLPVALGKQTCLIDCRTAMAQCFKAAKIKYNVTDPKIPPPQAYFNELSACAISKDNVCRASCPAINANATAPTQQ